MYAFRDTCLSCCVVKDCQNKLPSPRLPSADQPGAFRQSCPHLPMPCRRVMINFFAEEKTTSQPVKLFLLPCAQEHFPHHSTGPQVQEDNAATLACCCFGFMRFWALVQVRLLRKLAEHLSPLSVTNAKDYKNQWSAQELAECPDLGMCKSPVLHPNPCSPGCPQSRCRTPPRPVSLSES